jgi:hypothetical protein
MSLVDWRKLGNYRPDGDLYLMNVFHAIMTGTPIEMEKGSAVIFADVKGFEDLTDDMEKVFNDEMLYDDPSDKNKKAFKQKYSGKKCLRVIYRNNQSEEKLGLTKIKKTAAFGGGVGGSGAGSKATEMFESAACWVTAVRFTMGNTDIANGWSCSHAIFDTVKDRVHTTASMPDVCSFLQRNPKWMDTSISTANTIYNAYKGGDYIFYRGKGIVDGIEEHFKGVNGIARRDPEDNGFSNINKWTPADIYLCDRTSEGNILRNIKQQQVFGTLNPLMEKYLDSHELVGISLKSLKPGSSGTLRPFNTSGVVKETKTFKRAGMKENAASLLSSMDVYLFGGFEIQFRATDTAGKTWQGEIIGTEAKHGKLGGGVMDYIIKKVYGKGLFDATGYADTKAIAAASKTDAGKTKMAEKISEIAKKHHVGPDADDVTVPMLKQQKSKWLFSKFIGMTLVDMAYSQTSQTKRNELMTAIYLYASSQSDNSAPYMKIS